MDLSELRRRWSQTLPVDASDLALSTATYRPSNLRDEATVPLPGSWEAPGLEGFAVGEELGSGGVGVVYRAHQRSLARDVALKQLKIDGDPRRRASFIAEARLNGRLSHPNIVPVHTLGVEDGVLSMAMKLVEGRTWASLLAETAGPAELGFHLPIFLQVCHAVAFAHARGIVHNDLKPENVLIGQFGEVWVLDWGLAMEVGPRVDGGLRHVSELAGPCGTPRYMAPELANGDGGEIGPWTDIYLLGGILYRLLTGRPPHLGVTVWEVIAAASKGRVDPLPLDAPTLLRKICSRALAATPEVRFQTVSALRREVASYLEHRESLAVSARAEALLEAGGDDAGPYEAYVEAIALFGQATRLWAGNEGARAGEERARLAYAEEALRRGDLGLAEAQSARLGDSHAPRALAAAIARARSARRRETRLRRRLQWGLAASVLALLLWLSVSLWWIREEKHYADRRGAIAERTLDALEEQVSRTLLPLGDARGRKAARELLGVALDNWEALRAVNTAEDRASLGSARALRRIARLRFDVEGSVASASPLNQEAIGLYRALLAAAPDDAGMRGELVAALTHQALMERHVGRADAALALYEEALAEARARFDADDADSVLDLSWALVQLAGLVDDRGDWARARPCYEEAIALRAGLQGRDGVYGAALAKVRQVYARALYDRGEREQAAALLAPCVETYARLLHAGTDHRLRGDQAEALELLGTICLETGRDDEALRHLLTSLRLRRERLAAAPESRELRRELMVGLNALGQVLLALGRRLEAQKTWGEALSLSRELHADDPEAETGLRDLGIALGRLAKHDLDAGDAGAADALLAEVVALRAKLLDKNQDSAVLRRDLAVGLSWWGRAAMALEDRDAAVERFTESIVLREQLIRADTASVQARRDLMLALGWLGDAQLLRGEESAAEATYLEALALRRAVTSTPPTPSERENLATALERLVELASRRGDLEAGRDLAEESVALRRERHAEDSADASTREGLAVALGNLAWSLERLGDRARAARLRVESLTLWRGLVEDGVPDAERSLTLALREHARWLPPPQALPLLEEVCERFHGLGDGSARARDDLAEALRDLAMMRGRLGVNEGADMAFRLSLMLHRELRDELAHQPRWTRSLARGLSLYGDFQLQTGRAEEAVPTLAEAVELERETASGGISRRGLSLALVRLGDARAEAESPEAARACYTEAVELSRASAEERPEDAGARRDLSYALVGLAGNAEARGAPDEALAALREAQANHAPLAGSGAQADAEIAWLAAELRRLQGE